MDGLRQEKVPIHLFLYIRTQYGNPLVFSSLSMALRSMITVCLDRWVVQIPLFTPSLTFSSSEINLDTHEDFDSPPAFERLFSLFLHSVQRLEIVLFSNTPNGGLVSRN